MSKKAQIHINFNKERKPAKIEIKWKSQYLPGKFNRRISWL